VGGDDHHRPARPAPDDLGEELHAVHPRHAKVGDDHVKSAARTLERLDRVVAVGDRLHLVALPDQEASEDGPHVGFVVDDQDAWGHAHGSSG
jgi:hypothetical protein